MERIPNEDKLIECLIQQSTSVYAMEEGMVAEAISAATDGITLRGVANAFKLAGIHLAEQDKSYFSSYFAVPFNPSFLDLKELI